MTNCDMCSKSRPQVSGEFWLCIYIGIEGKVFKDCPCSECLIKVVCHSKCDKFNNVIKEREIGKLENHNEIH